MIFLSLSFFNGSLFRLAKPLKYGLTGFCILSLFLFGAESWTYLFFLDSIFGGIMGLIAESRKQFKSKGLMSLAIGLLVLTASRLKINEYIVEEQLAIEVEAEHLTEIEGQEEQERLAEKND